MPSFESMSDIPDTPVFDELESDHSLDRQQPGRLTKSALLALTRALLPQFTRPVVFVKFRRNATPTNWYVAVRRPPKGPKRRAA